jgi:hypothetical protein
VFLGGIHYLEVLCVVTLVIAGSFGVFAVFALLFLLSLLFLLLLAFLAGVVVVGEGLLYIAVLDDETVFALALVTVLVFDF